MAAIYYNSMLTWLLWSWLVYDGCSEKYNYVSPIFSTRKILTIFSTRKILTH